MHVPARRIPLPAQSDGGRIVIAVALTATVLAIFWMSWLLAGVLFPEPLETPDLASNRLLAEVREGVR